MKKYLLATTAAGAAMALTAPAQADGYLKVFGGASFLDDQNFVMASSSSTGTSFSYTAYYAVFYPGLFASSTGPATALPVTSGGWLTTPTATTMTTGGGTLAGTMFGVTYNVYNFSSMGTFSSSTRADMNIDTGFVIGAAAGTQVNPCLSLELEVAYRKANADIVFSYRTFASGASQFSYVYHTARFFHVADIATATSMTTGGGTIGIPTNTGVIATGTMTSSVTTVTPTNVFTVTSSSMVSTTTVTTTTLTTTGPGTMTTMNVFYSVPLSGSGTTMASGTTTAQASGEISSFAIMANAVWDFAGNGDGNLHPYIGAGIGWANVDVDLGATSISDSGIAYQAFIGLGWDLTDNTRINVEGRYFAVTQLEHMYFGRDLEIDYDVAEIIVGLQYNF